MFKIIRKSPPQVVDTFPSLIANINPLRSAQFQKHIVSFSKKLGKTLEIFNVMFHLFEVIAPQHILPTVLTFAEFQKVLGSLRVGTRKETPDK